MKKIKLYILSLVFLTSLLATAQVSAAAKPSATDPPTADPSSTSSSDPSSSDPSSDTGGSSTRSAPATGSNGKSGIPACDIASNSAVCKTDSNLIGGILKNVINLILYLAGTIAVIVIVIGGLRYITSDGDPQKASQARNSIIYALIGLAVAVLSFSIVNFVVGQL